MAFKKRVIKRKMAPRRRKVVKRAKGRTSIVKAVRQAMARTVEVKHRDSEVLQFSVVSTEFPSTFDGTVRDVGLTPTGVDINQGVGQGQRVGNKVTLKSMILRVILAPYNYQATLNPLPAPAVIRFVVFYDKLNPHLTPSPQTSGDILDFNNGTSRFLNDLLDSVVGFNTDRYRILVDRKVKLGYSSYTGTGTTAANQSYNNNEFKYNANFTVDLAKFLPKNITYNDNTSEASVPHGLSFMCIPCRADGAPYAIAANSTTVALGQYYIRTKYTDV